MWTNSLRTAVFAATLVEYLQDGALLSLQQVAEILGSKYLAPYSPLQLRLTRLRLKSNLNGKIDLRFLLRTTCTVSSTWSTS